MQAAQRPTPKLRATAAGGKGCPCSSSDGERKALRGGETPTAAEGVPRNAASLSPWTSSGGLDLRAKEEMSSPPPLTRIPSRADRGASRSSSSAGRGKLRGSPARFCVSPGRANATPYRWQAEPPSASPSPSLLYLFKLFSGLFFFLRNCGKKHIYRQPLLSVQFGSIKDIDVVLSPSSPHISRTFFILQKWNSGPVKH